MRVMTYNIWEGGTGGSGDRSARLEQVIRQAGPDIIALQEANNEKLFYGFSRWLEMPQAILGHGIHGYHLGLLTRYPVEDWKMHDNREIFRHGLLEAHLQTPLGRLACFVIHLFPGYDDQDEEQRVREITYTIAAMQPYFDGPALLVGDFNTLSPQDELRLADWPRYWQKRLHKQDDTIKRDAIQLLLEAGYQDSYRHFYPSGPNYQPGYTLPANQPNVRLDYCFITPSLAARLQSCAILSADPAPHASDHLPLLIELI